MPQQQTPVVYAVSMARLAADALNGMEINAAMRLIRSRLGESRQTKALANLGEPIMYDMVDGSVMFYDPTRNPGFMFYVE